MIFQNFINGELVSPAAENFFAKESPFTGELLGQVPLSSAMDFVQALQGAKKAAAAMQSLTLEQRREILIKFANKLTEKKEAYAYQEGLHQGLPASFVLNSSIEPAIKILRNVAEQLAMGSSDLLQARPTGVIAILPSWNLSLFLCIERLAPALAAGNAVIIKLSELSPVTGSLLAELLLAGDLPAGAVQLLHGNAELAQLIMSHPGIRAVSLVGRQSTFESGTKSILNQGKKIQFAGPAKNVSSVIAGFDLQAHFSDVLSSFLIGQGQLCWNSSRLLILESLTSEFYPKLQEAIETLKPLRDPSGDSMWTPMISRALQQKAKQDYEMALSEKGNLLARPDANPEQGFYTQPVFVRDLTNCSLLHQDELQTPIFLANSVKYQHEISKWVNNSYLGHSSFIWGDAEKALKVSQTLDVAHVSINQWKPGQIGSVFGAKQSSFGNLETAWNGSFYSDVKFLTMPTR